MQTSESILGHILASVISLVIFAVVFYGLGKVVVNKILKKDNKSITPKQKSLFTQVINYMDFIILLVGGILISLRLFFPPQYYLIQGLRVSDRVQGVQGLYPISDYQTALLHSLGIAVISGVLFFIIRNIREKFLKPERENEEGQTEWKR